MKQPELGKKILELRLAKGYTQTELADKSNVSLRTIQRVESAEVTPRSFTIKTIFSNLDFDFYNSTIDTENSIKMNSQETNWLKQFYINYLDVFNLKINTMKKVSFLSTILTFIVIGIFLFKTESRAQSINGWFKRGSKSECYEIGFDKSTLDSGKKCAYLASTQKVKKGFGTLMQTCDAKMYLGKRIKMTGYIKSEDIERWAGMWLRVDSKYQNKSLSFDNMFKRAIKGTTDWTKYEIILDVPMESGTLNFGVLIDGEGKVWFDKINFEIVEDLPITNEKTKIPDRPSNIDFEN